MSAVYVPPAKLKAQLLATNNGPEYQQRMAWDALQKRINGMVNRVNAGNIKQVVVELFGENLLRGRGLFVKSLIKAQHASPLFTPCYAALVAVVNSKLPAVGALLVGRLIVAFQQFYKENDKQHLLSCTKFLAHLINQQVAHEIVALQILALLLERSTDDSVEVAIGFVSEVGAYLSEASPKACHAIFEKFRSILQEGSVDRRVQYMIEVLFQVRKEKFKDHPTKSADLDLVEEDDQMIHYICLDDEIDTEDSLDVFLVDDDFEANEQKYAEIKREILGDSEDEQEEEEENDGGDDQEISGDESMPVTVAPNDKTVDIIDNTETNVVNLRKTIYLTIMSSLDFEEACHKLLRIAVRPGQESHMCSMIVECCSQERVYEKYYGSIGERFCKINKMWMKLFAEEFAKLYDIMHRYETNRIRNIAKFFAHLLSSGAMPWIVLSCIKLTEDDTTSSSRIFIKILFQTLYESMGINELKIKLEDASMQDYFIGLFPVDDPQNIRFSINYFTSIGLGPLTDRMREILKLQTTRIASEDLERQLADTRSREHHERDEIRPKEREDKYHERHEKDEYGRESRRRSYERSRSRETSVRRDRGRERYSRSPPRRQRNRSRDYRDDRRRRSPSPYRKRTRSRSYERRKSPEPDRYRKRNS